MEPFSGPPFKDREFYEALGLKVGLEIHQQLLTEKKLFCRCPAGCYSDEYHAEILRHMRPTLSELGEYDGTALMEFRTRKEIIYRLNNNSVCTYEMDDTPPFHIDEPSVDIALQIALVLECNIVSEIHIARKQYLDGSIPTGFQRTTVVGLDGALPVGEKVVHVIQLGLEEDACREVSDIGHDRVYLTDRLGMPLIEVVTAPEMHTPYEAYLAAQSIRSLTRSTGKVRTGIGSGREDVNVSITGGRRVEIKGVPRITRIPYLVHNEAVRQRALLDIRDELKRRGYERSAITEVRASVTDLVRQTGYVPVRDAVMNGDDVVAVRCDGFADLLKKETQPGRPFIKEFSDRVRVVACLDRLPNIACSDFAGSELRASEWREIMKAAHARKDDAVIIVWGKGKDLTTAVEELEGRAREAFDGVPNETRQALRDNTNGFERILPGPDRMYPDTDLPPRKITEEHLERVRRATGMSAVRWEDLRRHHALASHLGTGLYRNGYAQLFLDIVQESAVHAPFVASILVDKIVRRVKRGRPVPGAEEIRRVFADLAAGKYAKDDVKSWADGKQRSAVQSSPDARRPSPSEIDGQARALLARADLRSRDPRARVNFCIGALKKRFDGALDGAATAKRLEEMEPQTAPFRKEE